MATCKSPAATSPALWYILWDPTQSTATRPLAIQKDSTWYTYGWDLTKNICEIYGQSGYIRTLYTYTPYGAVTADGDVTQPIQWSSEFYDAELGLVYYNYRHYNTLTGAWLGRDRVERILLYPYCANSPIFSMDYIGNQNHYYFGGAPASANPTTGHVDYTTKPSTAESLIPIWGSMREALYAFGQGNIGEGIVHSILAVTDIMLIKSLITSGAKFAIKTGSHSWSATRKWYGKMLDLPKNTEVHHVFFHQHEGIGAYLPRWFINQPWNLEPIFATAGKTSKQIHINIIHCKKIKSFTDAGLLYKYSLPSVYKELITSTADKGVKMFQGIITKGEEEDNIEMNINIDIEIPDDGELPEVVE